MELYGGTESLWDIWGRPEEGNGGPPRTRVDGGFGSAVQASRSEVYGWVTARVATSEGWSSIKSVSDVTVWLYRQDRGPAPCRLIFFPFFTHCFFI